jgi:hypothetical protein
MVLDQSGGVYPVAKADYSGFGAFIAQTYLNSPPTPPPAGGDDQGKVRVGIVRGAYISDNPSIGGQF